MDCITRPDFDPEAPEPPEMDSQERGHAFKRLAHKIAPKEHFPQGSGAVMEQGKQEEAPHATGKLRRKFQDSSRREPASSSTKNEADQLKKELSLAKSEIERLRGYTIQLEINEQSTNQINHRLKVELSEAHSNVERLLQTRNQLERQQGAANDWTGRLTAELLQAQEQNKQLCNILAETSGQYNDLVQEKSKLQTKWEDAARHVKALSLQLQSTVHEGDEAHHYQKADDAILSAFNNLVSQVKTWARGAMSSSTPAVIEDIQAGDLEKLRHVAPQVANIDDLGLYVSTTKLRKYFITGIVFLMILESVFQDLDRQAPSSDPIARDHWLPGDVRDSVRLLEQHLLRPGVKLEAYHSWRSNTMSLLGPVQPVAEVKCAQDFMEAEATKIMLTIRPFLGEEIQPTLGSSLFKVLNLALTLALSLRRQRAAWCLRFPGIRQGFDAATNIEFDSEQMKDIEAGGLQDEDTSMEDDSSVRRVGLFIAPALHKKGNMDGEKYDEVYVVQKALVWVSDSY